MKGKNLTLSAAGLKNVVIESPQNQNFRFIFGKQIFSICNFFADFISPKVSKIHKSDPTINSISF